MDGVSSASSRTTGCTLATLSMESLEVMGL